MPNFNANLTMMYTEVDFLDRFESAARSGFTAVEYLFPYEWEKEELVERLEANNLKQILHNLPAGDWGSGERGVACIPGREQEFQDGVGRAIEYATALKCPLLNCLAGITPEGVAEEAVRETLVKNVRFAAEELEKAGIKLLLEAINYKDMPGFHLNNSEQTMAVIEEVGHSNVQYQYDIYHMQRMEGDLIVTIESLIDSIGHMQLADNPGRHEPGTGEINFPVLFKAIDATGYQGWIGCEYIPAGVTEDGLGWIKELA